MPSASSGDEALEKWESEVKVCPTDTWGGRLVVFVQLESPCHANNARFSTHGALVDPCSKTLDVLWGWSGFAQSSRTLTADNTEASTPRDYF